MLAESFNIRPSRVLLFLLAIIHVGTLGVILSYADHVFLKWFGSVVCALSFMWNLKYTLKTKKVFWNAEEGWKVQYGSGGICSAKVVGQNTCLPWVVGLNFSYKPEIIFFDAMDAETFRRLRVLLIHKS